MKKFLIAATLSLSLGVAGVSAFAVDSGANKEVIQTEAANTGSAGDVIFFTPSNHWAEASATFKLQWYKNGSYLGGAFMNTVSFSGGKMSSRTTYYAAPTAAFDAVQILRFNPQKSSQWNYSNNSSVSGSNRWLVMTASCNWDNTWCAGDSSGTYWSAVDINKAGSDQTASTSTTRIFINNSGSHFNPAGIRAWGGDASASIGGTTSDATIYHLNWFEDRSGVWYGYAEIPTNITGCKVVKLSSDDYDATVSYYCSNNDFAISDIASRVLYCPADGNQISFGGAKDDVAGASLMAKVLEAINTCSDSSLNGYNSYTNVNNFFYSHATAEAKSSTCTSLGGQSKTVSEHMEGMARRPGSLPGSNILGSIAANDTSILLIAVGAVTLLSAGGYFLLRKKKEN